MTFHNFDATVKGTFSWYQSASPLILIGIMWVVKLYKHRVQFGNPSEV